MKLIAQHIYWTSTEPHHYYNKQKPGAGESFATVVVIGEGSVVGNSDTLTSALRTICPDAPPDDILIGVIHEECPFKGKIAATYSVVLPRVPYPNWESIDGEPTFL